MRHILFLHLTFLTLCFFSKGQASTNLSDKIRVNFLTKIDLNQSTKDGIYLNGYIVNIPYEKLITLNGKTVRIKGKVTIVKGNKHYNDIEIRQGRQEDSKHILKPKVRVIDG